MKFNKKTQQFWLALAIVMVCSAVHAAPQTDGTLITWGAGKSVNHAELTVVGPAGFQLSEKRDVSQLTLGLSDANGSPLADGVYQYTLVSYRAGSNSAEPEMEDFSTGKFLLEGGKFVIPEATGTAKLGGAGPVMEVNGSVIVSDSDGSTALKIEETSSLEATRALATLSNNGGVGVILKNTSPVGLEWAFLNSPNGTFAWTALGTGATEMLLTPATAGTGGNLTVNGTITANMNGSQWPDYVFEDEYPLLSLDQLETFVSHNGHLPKIPSGQQIDEQGGAVNMTQLQLKMLEKIEELTLYTLQQHRTIETLEKRLAVLEVE